MRAGELESETGKKKKTVPAAQSLNDRDYLVFINENGDGVCNSELLGFLTLSIVQKPSNSECRTPSSKFVMLFLLFEMLWRKVSFERIVNIRRIKHGFMKFM
jgi:hypothetical protein